MTHFKFDVGAVAEELGIGLVAVTDPRVVAELRRTLENHDAARHDLLPDDDPAVTACVWCQS